MRLFAWVFAGLLIAAALHVWLMSPGERARILRIAPSPAAADAARGQAADAAASARNGEPAAGGAAASPGSGATTDPGVPPTPAATPTRRQRQPAITPTPLPSGLVMPVQGVLPSQLTHTFEDARSGGRVHEALDIMAPAGTPVLAVADGHVEKLFDSRQGGLTIYQFEPSGRYAYYYAHLERYAPGLAEGQAIRQGQVLGHVGSSGNADPAAPHLHFAIFALGPEKRWWEGTPIDPYPLLAAPR